MRGIPNPGQLRPDLDPQQMLKAAKRLRTRMIDIPGANGKGLKFSDPAEDEPMLEAEPVTPKAAEPPTEPLPTTTPPEPEQKGEPTPPLQA